MGSEDMPEEMGSHTDGFPSSCREGQTMKEETEEV